MMATVNTIGSDPEFFIRDDETGGVLSAIGTVGGSKGRPRPLPAQGEGFGVQEDNVMVEYNIPACTTAKDFERSIRAGLEECVNLVRTKFDTPVSADVGACSRLFTFEQLADPQAQTFGCSQDFDAYSGGAPCERVNPLLLEVDRGGWRFAGGHVHIGLVTEVPDFVVAQFCDIFLGLPSLAFDKQGMRRGMYGTPGRYRPTSYGIEYRTLSNFWIFSSDLAYSVGERALSCANFLSKSEERMLQKVHAEIPWNDVRAAIEQEDESLAASILQFYDQILEEVDRD